MRGTSSMMWLVPIAAFAAGCTGGGACETDTAGEAATLALDGVCVTGVTVTARRDGAWEPAALEATEVSGGVRVVARAGDRAEALRVVVPGVAADRVLQQGYQSWSFTGTVEIPPAVPMDEDGAPLMEAGRTGDPIHEVHGVSFHAAVLRDGAAGPAIVAGALSAEHATTGIATTGRDGTATIDLVYGVQREELPAGDGGAVSSEALVLAAAPTPEEALDRLAEALAAEHAGARTPARPPGGWFSWNEHFADIDAALIRAHIDVVAGELAPRGMPLVEIDDGWEIAWGDWQANARFPDGMAALGAEITDRGLVAGIWLAPFLVDVTSQTAATVDSSVFVAGDDGAPLVHQISGISRSFYVLDGTNPEAMAVATDAVADLAAAGYTFFKLDFLYAGALRGQRSRDVTGVEALREGLARIRAAAGEDAIVNACGAPTLPMLGVADSLRIGPDTAFEGFDLTWSLVAAAARNLSTRAHLFPAIWLDADQVQLRPPYGADEAHAGAVVAALAGPAYSLGDDLVALSDDRAAMALDPMVLDIAGAAAPPRFDGVMEAVGTEIASSPIIEAARSLTGMVAVPPPRFVVTGASGDRYEIVFDWEGEHTATVTPL